MSLPATLPAPRVPDPRDAPPVRWGVLGTGWIAERFVDALQRRTRQPVVAVGSRSPATARAFADRCGVDRTHGSYEALVADDDVDVVYVATPHHAHRPHARLALEAGKHVLVEKPLALNAAEAREVAELAARAGRFCAEAMWTLYLPKFDVIRQLLDARVLGELRTVLADHGEWFGPGHRIQRQDLAGGPLLDLGSYPLALATWVLGRPEQVAASGQPAPSGVNGQTSVLLTHARGAQSVLHTTILSNTPTTATVAGSAATLTVPGPFFRPGGFAVTAPDGTALHHTEDEIGYAGLAYEAAEVARRVAAGEAQTPARPLADSVATLAVLDEVRRQVGVVWDEER